MYSLPLYPGTELFQNHLHNFPFVEWLWGMGGRHIRSDTALNTNIAAYCSYACIQYPSDCMISRTGSATVYSLIFPFNTAYQNLVFGPQDMLSYIGK